MRGGERLRAACAGVDLLLLLGVGVLARGGLPVGSAIPKDSDDGLVLRALALLAGVVWLPVSDAAAVAKKGLGAGAGTATLGEGESVLRLGLATLLLRRRAGEAAAAAVGEGAPPPGLCRGTL